jgi:hypothetical protein
MYPGANHAVTYSPDDLWQVEIADEENHDQSRWKYPDDRGLASKSRSKETAVVALASQLKRLASKHLTICKARFS